MLYRSISECFWVCVVCLLCFTCFGLVEFWFFPFGACLETEFLTGDSLGFYLLINFPIGLREGNNYCECSCLCIQKGQLHEVMRCILQYLLPRLDSKKG